MITLVLVDDHPVVAQCLGALLACAPDITVVGIAHDPRSGADLMRSASPEIVLCDVGLLAADDGLDLLAAYGGQARFIMLSAYTFPDHVVRALMGGARGYLSKLARIDEIVAAIRAVAAGGQAFPPNTRNAIRISLAPPSSDELALVGLVAQGRSYAEISALLATSERGVESRLRRLFRRYDVPTRLALVRLAHAQGWIATSRGKGPVMFQTEATA